MSRNVVCQNTNHMQKSFTIIDQAVVHFDGALRTLLAPARSKRPTPGADLSEATLSAKEKKHVAGLMRVNHVGEVCAQALYQAQALTSSKSETREALQHAADEEIDHLAWTSERIAAMGGHKSVLNPFWYGGAFTFGAIAGLAGDRWNLGFLAETEKQVAAHLQSHIARVPTQDQKSLAVLAQMHEDESAHANTAQELGASLLPFPVKIAMRAASKVMTTVAYWI